MKILKKINKGIEYCVNNDFRFLVNAGRGKYNSMSDEEYIKKMFKAKLGYELNLENPKTFNEKLQWLKINDRNDMYTTLVDKYAVKKYVSDILGEEYIIPTLGVWDRFEDIEFDNLPEQFVLKCTHDSGGLVICKNKKELNHAKAKKIIDSSLKTNFYWHGREWPYRDVKPRLIAESYMEDEKTSELRDYKFFCFSGTVKCFKIDFDRFINHRANYYGRDMQLLDFGEKILRQSTIKTWNCQM